MRMYFLLLCNVHDFMRQSLPFEKHMFETESKSKELFDSYLSAHTFHQYVS